MAAPARGTQARSKALRERRAELAAAEPIKAAPIDPTLVCAIREDWPYSKRVDMLKVHVERITRTQPTLFVRNGDVVRLIDVPGASSLKEAVAVNAVFHDLSDLGIKF